MSEYPPNPSRKPRVLLQQEEQAKQPEKVTRVVTGEVKRRKKPLRDRMIEKVNGNGVLGFMFGDVLVPFARDAVVQAFAGGLERAVYGEARGSIRPSYRPGGGHTPYNRYGGGGRAAAAPPREVNRVSRRMEQFEDLILPTRSEAVEVIDRMFHRCEQYGNATVSDLYEMVGITPAFTDERRGWDLDSIQDADIRRDRDGHRLILPPPERIS